MKKSKRIEKRAATMTAEATSDSGRIERKGGGSLDEAAHRSHTISRSELRKA